MSSMSTAPRPHQPPHRPQPLPTGAGGGSGGASIDPIKLLKQYKWVLAAAVVAGAMLGLVAHFVLLRVSPLYRATVIYQGLPPMADIRQEITLVDREEFDRYMLTQVNTMTSDRILRETIRNSGDRLVQDSLWAKGFVDNNNKIIEKTAVAELKKMISASVRPGTSLIELSVTTDDKNDAPLIVNMVHQEYWKDLASLTTSAQDERLDPLSKSLVQYRDDLQRLETRMTSLRAEKQITGTTGQELVETTSISTLQPMVSTRMAELERARTDLKRLEDMIKLDVITYSDELKDLVERDPVIYNLKSNSATLASRINQLTLDGKGENHRAVVEARNQLESTNKELDQQRETLLRKLFNAEVERQRRIVDSTQAELNKLKSEYDAASKRREELSDTVSTLASLEQERNRLNDRIIETRKEIENIQYLRTLVKSTRIARIRMLEQGRTPDFVYFPQLKLILPLGIVLVLAVTGGVIFLRELLDQRIKGPSDIASIPRVRMLGIVPLASEDLSRPVDVATAFRDAPTGAVSEGFRQLRAPLSKRMMQAGYKSLLVISAMPEAGATTVVSNLAMGAAASELKVLMIDANFRRPALHRIFKLGEGPGLGDVLNKKATLDSAVQQTTMPNLHLLAAGSLATRAVPERLGTESMSQIIREASDKYDLVILDSAPAIVAGDGLALANRTDAVTLVVRANSDKRGLIARMRDQLGDVRAEFLGVVVNAVRSNAGGYLRKNIRAAQEYQSGGTPNGTV